MADEVAVPAEATTEQAQTATSAETVNTEQQPAEHMIPKSRFDAINDELKQLKKLAAQEAKQREVAEAERLKEQGKYEQLFQKAQAELEQERQRAKALEIAGLRRDVAAKRNLPTGLVDRLRGDTLEELEADAEALLAALPKPAAPNINAGDANSKPGKGMLSDEELEQKAARLGVSLKYAKQFLSGQGA
jgi:hypothetical protein